MSPTKVGNAESNFHNPIILAVLFSVSALSISLGAAYIENRLFSAEMGVQPFCRNISTIIDFAFLNPLVIFFFARSALQKKKAYSRTGISQPTSLFHRFWIGILALALSIVAMNNYVSSFLNGTYLDATIVLKNGVPSITITGWVVFVATTLFMAYVIFMLFDEVNYARFILALDCRKAPYAPFNADESGGMKFLADPILTSIYAAMSVAAIFLVFIIQDHLINKINISNRLQLLSIYAPCVVALFWLPLYRLHLIMAERRRGYIDGLATFIDEKLGESIVKRIDAVEHVREYLSLIEYVEKYRKLCAELPLWPIPVKSLAVPVSSVIASLAPLLQKILSAAWAFQ